MIEWVDTQTDNVTLLRRGIHIVDLSPLRLCPNLRTLDFVRNKIQLIDLNPLSDCANLETLYISFNQLKSIDLKPIHKCTKLKRASFRKNPFESIDVSPLFACLELEVLKLENTAEVYADERLKSIQKKPPAISNLFGRIHWKEGLHSPDFIEKIRKSTSRVVKPISKPSRTIAPKKLKALSKDGKVKMLRGCEIVGGKFDYKAKIQNESPYVITNITVTIVAFPADCMVLEGEMMKTISRIEPAGFRSPQFTFAPTKDCVEGQILTTVSYVDYQNQLQILSVEPYVIRSVCDLLKPLQSTAEEFESLLSDLTSASEEHSLEWNAQILFAKALTLLPMKNFHVVSSSDRLIGGRYTGTIQGFAEGKYTGKKVALQILFTGLIDENQSSVVIEGLGEDISMIPTTIDEISAGIEAWTCIRCGASLNTEDVTSIRSNHTVACKYCKSTLTIDVYRK